MDPKTLLRKLQDYYARHGSMPSPPALALMLGKSEIAIERSLDLLAREGILRKSGEPESYSASEAFFETSLSSEAIPAGVPVSVAADAGSRESINLQSYLVRSPSQTILIPVKGDSMIDAGIFNGDIAVVETNRPGVPGDIVVARLDGAFTLKRLAKKGKTIFLQPENKNYSDMIPLRELEIQGVVVGIVRKLLH